ncbi:MAG: vWA domain-containing protein [Gammaproteobacteria bacterium]
MKKEIPNPVVPTLRRSVLAMSIVLAACVSDRDLVEQPADGPVSPDAVQEVPPPQVTPQRVTVPTVIEQAAVNAPAEMEAKAEALADQSARSRSTLRKEAAQVVGAAAPALESKSTGMPMAAGAYAEADAYTSMPAPMPAPFAQANNTERYQHLADNAVKQVASEPVSTFSLDVDTGSYSNVRRFLAQGQLPPQDAVRVEELVNYFPYSYGEARGEHPFAVGTELAPCPWNPGHWLLRVSVKADEVAAREMPPANLVFLVDVSGSMDDPAKLPLLKSSLKLLVDQLRAEDRVSLVVYAGREAVVLEPTAGSEREKIRRAIDNLSAGGSTAGEAGIRLAYRMAKSGYIKGGINRVLIATDGDFNVGLTDFEALKDLVERERESGVQFSSLGFGTGNYNEQLMEQLADAGNGSYGYIDTLQEGRKVLVDQVRSTLVTVAKDVKVQVEFNPQAVGEYRLIGYENRVLAREDFNNDKVDAGDVGAGATVTALYEITPAGGAATVDPLRYGAGKQPEVTIQHRRDPADAEIAFVKLRYKQPDGSTSKLVTLPVARGALKPSFDKASDDLRFAAAVAGFGQLLRGGKYTGHWTYDDVLQLANGARGKDEFGYRAEFTGLVRMAKTLGGS